jgi:hypothetical protein
MDPAAYWHAARYLSSRFSAFDNATLGTPRAQGTPDDAHIGWNDILTVARGVVARPDEYTSEDKAFANWIVDNPEYFRTLAQLPTHRPVGQGETNEYVEPVDLWDVYKMYGPG